MVRGLHVSLLWQVNAKGVIEEECSRWVSESPAPEFKGVCLEACGTRAPHQGDGLQAAGLLFVSSQAHFIYNTITCKVLRHLRHFFEAACVAYYACILQSSLSA